MRGGFKLIFVFHPPHKLLLITEMFRSSPLEISETRSTCQMIRGSFLRKKKERRRKIKTSKSRRKRKIGGRGGSGSELEREIHGGGDRYGEERKG
jgi:hypothetical protein